MGGRGGSGSRNSTGIPSSMPSKEEVLKAAKALKGKALEKAITELEWDGDWYREDKRMKKDFVTGVVENNYVRDPAESGSGYFIADQIDTNKKILAAVYGINRYGKDFEERFGSYDVDRIYERARR